jgi:hypothetical protein
MDYSLSWLREPDVEDALPDLITGMIRDIRLILVHPDLGNAAKLAAITEAVDQFAPPPGPWANGAEATGLQAAASIVALLARNPGPATLLFEQLAQEQIRVELTARAERLLTSAECHELRTDPGSSGHYRSGTLRMVTTGLVVAEVTSLVLPWRLPPAARDALGIPNLGDPLPPPSTVPFGKALAEFGVLREPLGARLVRDPITSGGHVSAESSALMWLGEVPVALAGERVTAQFCRHAVSRLTHPAGQAQRHRQPQPPPGQPQPQQGQPQPQPQQGQPQQSQPQHQARRSERTLQVVAENH